MDVASIIKKCWKYLILENSNENTADINALCLEFSRKTGPMGLRDIKVLGRVVKLAWQNNAGLCTLHCLMMLILLGDKNQEPAK